MRTEQSRGSANLGYTAYQARTQWYVNHWGPPAFVRESVMEDGRTKLGVMGFAPVAPDTDGRHWWTFSTNGVSERRMPCLEEPHGDPTHRLELVAYANGASDWVSDLLVEIARYPFEHRSGLAIGHTIPVIPKPGNLWSGYLLLRPRFEPQEFNPLAIEVGFGGDWVFFAEVIGLKDDELRLAIEIGGPEFTRRVVARCTEGLEIDLDRRSLLGDDEQAGCREPRDRVAVAIVASLARGL